MPYVFNASTGRPRLIWTAVIPYLRDINPAVYIPGQSTVANTNSRRPMYPDFERFSIAESVINSSYHALAGLGGPQILVRADGAGVVYVFEEPYR